MKYLALLLFLLIAAWDIYVYRNGRRFKNKERELTDTALPVFHTDPHYMPVKGDCDIDISDYFESEHHSLLQLHCIVTQNDKPVRGFCSKDLTPFEQTVRAEIRKMFERLGDEKTDRTVKIWIKEDPDVFDSNDLPLNIMITFYKPQTITDPEKEALKSRLYSHLQELVRVDWDEVNEILQSCYEKEHTLIRALNQISTLPHANTDISDSGKNICRHLAMDMAFFYKNQHFYGGGSSSSVYENLKAKYPEISDCYLESLSHEYARDTVF